MACHYAPDDFRELSFEGLKTEIEKGSISIDWWEDEQPQYYLRARHVYAPVFNGSWGGRCIHLTESGCALPFDQRPTGGKSLKPRASKDGKCILEYTTEMCKTDWEQYGDMLGKLVEYF